jgi:hypothetical protein
VTGKPLKCSMATYKLRLIKTIVPSTLCFSTFLFETRVSAIMTLSQSQQSVEVCCEDVIITKTRVAGKNYKTKST